MPNWTRKKPDEMFEILWERFRQWRKMPKARLGSSGDVIFLVEFSADNTDTQYPAVVQPINSILGTPDVSPWG